MNEAHGKAASSIPTPENAFRAASSWSVNRRISHHYSQVAPSDILQPKLSRENVVHEVPPSSKLNLLLGPSSSRARGTVQKVTLIADKKNLLKLQQSKENQRKFVTKIQKKQIETTWFCFICEEEKHIIGSTETVQNIKQYYYNNCR
ncbi:hypothetical protein QE152_g31970 [Popillia japonica]|uniref:Uncharacterized protein n=1 Tax=Popillia japonica TaxID=7064 RepID=A0AAW1J080_POPJA